VELRTGSVPEVQRRLETGSLSHDELKQKLQQSVTGSGDPAAFTANLPIQDLVSAAESGNLSRAVKLERFWSSPKKTSAMIGVVTFGFVAAISTDWVDGGRAGHVRHVLEFHENEVYG